MMNLGYSGPVGLPIPVSIPIMPLHLPTPPTPYPLPNPQPLATPPSCPFVTVLGGAIKDSVMCPLILPTTRMRNVSRNVSFPNPALEISFGWLLFINVTDSRLIILPHSLQEEFLQISTMCSHTLTGWLTCYSV